MAIVSRCSKFEIKVSKKDFRVCIFTLLLNIFTTEPTWELHALSVLMCITIYSVPLRTGTCYMRDILELFLKGYCALQESQMKMNFNLAVAPPLAYPMTSLLATPTHSLRQYGFLSEPPRQKQIAKRQQLKTQ